MNAPNETLIEMLHGSEADATAAIIEATRRGEDKVLRWNQIQAALALENSQVQMGAGDGKSLAYFAHVALEAVQHGAVQLVTTRDSLAGREVTRFLNHLGVLGFDVVRIDPDIAPPPPRPGKPTIYIGTLHDLAFADLRGHPVPGRRVTIDEIDEALVWVDTSYRLSQGAARPADAAVLAQVDFAHSVLGKEILTAADFGLAREQHGGTPGLTEGGRRTIERRLGRELSAGESNRLNMAAAARWEYVENVHYVRHVVDGQERIFIIDQVTHKVLFDAETGTESRWNGGLAQAIEREHGLRVRADPDSSKSLTVRELLSPANYDKVTGATGTASALGPDVVKIESFQKSQLEILADSVSRDEAALLRTVVADTKEMRATGRPQLILAHRNDIVAELSTLFHAEDPGHPDYVEHIAVDAKWFLEHGTGAEAALQRIFDAAGEEGKVLVINMQGARGVDIPITAGSRDLGGLHVAVTGRSELSHDIDIQAQARAARNGEPGSAKFYLSLEKLHAISDNPLVQQVVVKYVDEYTQAVADHRAAPTAETGARLHRAENDIRELVRPLQDEATAQHLRARAAVDHTSGPATRAPPPAQSDEDERVPHSPATNRLPQISAEGLPHAATAGHQEILAGKTGKWPAADAETLLRQAQDGHPAAAQALQRRVGPAMHQHVLAALG
ncbi:MAG: hypothetical protein HOQ44_23710, partial [Nocardia sp.]|nr:hypothetical protein [Nocardia sp.]